MTKTPPQDPGDETAPPPADSPVAPARMTHYCETGQHHLCRGTVFVWPPDESGATFVPCICTVPDCGHGRRDRKRT